MNPGRPTLETVARAAGVSAMTVSNAYNRPDQLSEETRARVLAVAGIAAPERFFESLQSAGWLVAGSVGFKDHHRYSASDARRIAEAAARSGAAAIVTTSKDVIKLAGLGPWPMPVVEMPLEVSVEPADEFRAWLLGELASVRISRGCST